MSTKKKTGNKLVASIRKSKTGTVAKKTSQRPGSTQTTKPKTVAAKSVPAEPKAERRKPVSTAARDSDRKKSFSSRRRVWPD